MITKIESLDNGNVMLLDGIEVISILIAVEALGTLSLRDDVVTVSKDVYLYPEHISSINGEAFSGDKNALLIKLGEVFTSASASMQQALEGKANLEGGNDLEGVQSILNANGEQLKLIQEAGVSEWGVGVGSDKDLLFKFLGSGKVRFTDDGTILAGGIHLFGSARLDSEYTIRDNRNNTILQQSAHTVTSNRTLTIGNATYKDIIFPNVNVGIGTTTPSARTHIVGEGSTSATTNFLLQNSSSSDLFKVTDDGGINAPKLPTSSAGLSSGDLWNDGGTLKIV